MNFTNLEYFLTLAKELNFTKAANKLYISQQSLSAHIFKLEKFFNVKLFDRKQPITLTPAGKCLFNRASEIFILKSTLEKEINNIKNNTLGELSIGVTVSRGPLILPSILKQFSLEYPSIKVNIFQQDSSQKLEESLLDGKVDLIIGFTPKDSITFDNIFLFKEKFVMIIPKKIIKKDYPNLKNLKIEIKNSNFSILKNFPFIKIESNKYAGIIFDNFFKEINLKPNIYATVSTIETMLSLCFAGLGIIIVPQIFISSLNKNFYLNIKKENIILNLNLNNNYSISISYLKKKILSFESQEFIRISKDILKIYN